MQNFISGNLYTVTTMTIYSNEKCTMWRGIPTVGLPRPAICSKILQRFGWLFDDPWNCRISEWWFLTYLHICATCFNKIYAERTKSKVVVAQCSGFFHGANSRVEKIYQIFSCLSFKRRSTVHTVHTTHLSLKVQNSTLLCWYLLWSQRISKPNFRLLTQNHQGSIHFWWPRHLRKSLGFWDWIGGMNQPGFCRSV